MRSLNSGQQLSFGVPSTDDPDGMWPTLAPALALLLTAAIMAEIVRQTVGLTGWSLATGYVKISSTATILGFALWIFFEALKLAAVLADDPLSKLRSLVVHKLPVMVLPAVVFPLFLASYTMTKTAIPFMVGYGWDRFWADADRFMLGVDAWTISWSILSPGLSLRLEWFYTMVWGIGLVFSGILVALYETRKVTARFFTAMMMTWLIGGCVMAYLTSAAGPVFVHLFDPTLASRYETLRSVLAEGLSSGSAVLQSQEYLAAAVNERIARRGGGISAMPSMHVSTAMIVLLAFWHRRWLRPIVLTFWALTLVGSVHTGYHYLLDGLIGSALAVLAWRIAGNSVFGLRSRGPAAPTGAAAAR